VTSRRAGGFAETAARMGVRGSQSIHVPTDREELTASLNLCARRRLDPDDRCCWAAAIMARVFVVVEAVLDRVAGAIRARRKLSTACTRSLTVSCSAKTH
jgi:hypothetical protein